MNLPNKLTITRVVLIPIFVGFLLFCEEFPVCRYIAVGVFILASITDFFDGLIARKRNLVTNFGKFMDPLADKLLVCSAMIALIELGSIPAWIVITIIAREFVISGFRLIASDNNVVIAASYWGKFKTTFQMVMVILMIVCLALPIQIAWLNILTQVIMWIALVLTIVSLVDYLVKNWGVMGKDF